MRGWCAVGAAALAAAFALGCSAGHRGGTVRPDPLAESEFGFRAGDARVEPMFVDLDGDGQADHVLTFKYERTRSEGYARGNCDTKYTVSVSLTLVGTNGERGRSWAWCATELPSRVWVEDGRVYLQDNLIRWVP